MKYAHIDGSKKAEQPLLRGATQKTNLQCSKADPGNDLWTTSFTPHLDSRFVTRSEATITNNFPFSELNIFPTFLCLPPDVDSLSNTDCTSATA